MSSLRGRPPSERSRTPQSPWVPFGRPLGVALFWHRDALRLIGLGALFALAAIPDWRAALALVGGVACVLFSTLVHEYAHALMAKRVGLQVADVRMHIVFGVTRIVAPIPPASEWRVALAGPAVNLVLAVPLALALALLPEDAALASALSLALIANLALGVLNLLPAFPMDGGRILRAWLATRIGHVRATRIAGRTGFVIVVALLALTALATLPGWHPFEPLGLRRAFPIGMAGVVVLFLQQRELRRLPPGAPGGPQGVVGG